MSHKHDRLLQDVFHDPVSANVHWRDIESLLNHLGAEVVGTHGTAMHLRLNGVEKVLHKPHHHHAATCSKQDIRQIREFIAAAGLAPSGH